MFQLGGDASNHQGAPVPPIRSSSAQQSNNGPYQQGSRTVGRRTGPAPAPPIQRPSRPPPMRPPTQPPPPPPSQNSSGGRNVSHPPPPPPMQPQVPKVIMTRLYLPQKMPILYSLHDMMIFIILFCLQPSVLNNSHINNTAPTPPIRNNSLKTSLPPGPRGFDNAGDQNSGSFEARFSSMFKTPQFLPPPEPFIASTKTYPSRNTTGTSTSTNNYNNEERGITFVTTKSGQRKSRKSVPAPTV